jgi:hypothetical protein
MPGLDSPSLKISGAIEEAGRLLADADRQR